MNTIAPMAWVSWGMVTFFYAFQYIIRVFPSIMMQDIMTKFNLNATDFGAFSSAYYIGYTLASIPFGVMLDKIGPKYVLPVAVILSVMGIVPLLYFDSWMLSVIGRVLVGAGSSAAILGVFKVTQISFPANAFSKILGVSVTIGLLGAIYGGMPINSLNDMFGWQNVLLGIIIAGFVFAATIFAVIPNSKSQSKGGIIKDLIQIAKNPTVLMTGLLAGLMLGPLEGFADVWGVSYLVNVLYIDKETASGLPSFIYLGMGVGCPVLAYLAEKFNVYKETIMFSSFYMAAAFAVLLLATPGPMVLSILFFTVGVACAYQVIMIYMNSRNVSTDQSSVVASFTNMVLMSFGIFFHTAISKCMDFVWDGAMINNLPSYGPMSYKLGLAIIPVSLVIAGFGMMFLKDPTKVRVGV